MYICLQSFTALLLSAFTLTLGIDLGSERAVETVSRFLEITTAENLLLPLQSEPVQHKDLSSQKNTSYLALVQSNTEEVQSATPVHRRGCHVEREAGNRSIHENAEVVAQVSTSHTESPHAGENEDRANSEHNPTNNGLVHWGVEGLLRQSDLVHMVTQYTKREDSEGEEIAPSVRATKNASQEVAVILCRRPLLADYTSTVVLGWRERPTGARNDTTKANR